MNELLEYWQRLKVFLKDLIQRIEESPLFERVVIKFESLEPRQQKAWRLGALYLSLAAIALVYVLPIWGVVSQKRDIQAKRKLLAELQAFNSENSVVRRPAPRPQGWTSLQAASTKDMETALSQYAESMGIPQDFINSSTTGSSIDLELKELSLRQALTLVYQVDGYHPAMEFESLRIGVHPTAKDLLELKMRARVSDPSVLANYTGAGGGAGRGGSNAGGPSGGQGSSFNGNELEGDDDFVPPPPPVGGKPGFEDDFDGAAPPLNFDEEDL